MTPLATGGQSEATLHGAAQAWSAEPAVTGRHAKPEAHSVSLVHCRYALTAGHATPSTVKQLEELDAKHAPSPSQSRRRHCAPAPQSALLEQPRHAVVGVVGQSDGLHAHPELHVPDAGPVHPLLTVTHRAVAPHHPQPVIGVHPPQVKPMALHGSATVFVRQTPLALHVCPEVQVPHEWPQPSVPQFRPEHVHVVVPPTHVPVTHERPVPQVPQLEP